MSTTSSTIRPHRLMPASAGATWGNDEKRLINIGRSSRGDVLIVIHADREGTIRIPAKHMRWGTGSPAKDGICDKPRQAPMGFCRPSLRGTERRVVTIMAGF
jgi:hypothetical protein